MHVCNKHIMHMQRCMKCATLSIYRDVQYYATSKAAVNGYWVRISNFIY